MSMKENGKIISRRSKMNILIMKSGGAKFLGFYKWNDNRSKGFHFAVNFIPGHFGILFQLTIYKEGK